MAVEAFLQALEASEQRRARMDTQTKLVRRLVKSAQQLSESASTDVVIRIVTTRENARVVREAVERALGVDVYVPGQSGWYEKR
jgi:adenylylsulfate kinase-like enzyme